MTSCRHEKLVLVGPPGRKLRCRHCHLTLDEQELGQGCCPECLEVRGERHQDFDEIETQDDGTVLYRCEECGALIEVGGS